MTLEKDDHHFFRLSGDDVVTEHRTATGDNFSVERSFWSLKVRNTCTGVVG